MKNHQEEWQKFLVEKEQPNDQNKKKNIYYLIVKLIKFTKIQYYNCTENGNKKLASHFRR